MNYQYKVRHSSLRFILKSIATQLVIAWHECAKTKYGDLVVGKLDYDELEIENEFIKHLSSAIESLIVDKSWEKKSTPGWSFGFVCGYIQGSLNIEWSNKYLVEPSREFKDLMKLKTVLELFRIDSDVLRKCEIIYDYFIAHSNEVTNKGTVLPDNVILLVQKKNKEQYRKEFNAYFEKLLMDNYMSLLGTYKVMCCPDLAEYLDEDEVIRLVGKEHFA